MARILVIEDDILMRRMFVNVLLKNGYEADCLSDGSNALKMHRQKKYDLIITDIFMPGVDGLDTISGLREIDPTLKIIAISGGGGRTDPDQALRRAVSLGANATIAKPFRKADIIRVVNSTLEKG